MLNIHVENENTGNYCENGLDKCKCGCDRKFFSKKQFNDYIKQFQNIKGLDADIHIFTVDREDVGEKIFGHIYLEDTETGVIAERELVIK